MPKLDNAKYEKFCRAYAISLNQTQAAIEAGYSPDSARNQGYRLMAKNEIQQRVQELIEGIQKTAEEKYDITIERVLQEYAKLAFYNPKDFYKDDGTLKPIGELTDEQAACILALDVQDVYAWDENEQKKVYAGVAKKIKLANKRTALDSLAKTLGMFQHNVNVKGSLLTAVEYVFGEDE